MFNHWILDPRTWRNALKIPPLEWWIWPSGGDVAPYKPWKWYHYVLESPISAHTLGAVLSFVIAFLLISFLPAKAAAAGVAVLVAVYGQGQKADALIPLKRYDGRNIVWRSLIALVASLGILVAVS